MELAVDRFFGGGWFDTLSGTGSNAVDSNGVLRCIGPAGSAAQKYMPILCNGGDVIELTVFARCLSGYGHLWINSQAGAGNAFSIVDIVGPVFKPYTIKCSVPVSYGHTYVFPSVGIFTAEAGDCEFYSPTIKLISSNCSARQIIASGLIKKIVGSPIAIHTGYANRGIESVSLLDNVTVKIQLSRKVYHSALKPMVKAGGTPDKPLIVFAGQFDAASGSFILTAYDILGDPGRLTQYNWGENTVNTYAWFEVST